MYSVKLNMFAFISFFSKYLDSPVTSLTLGYLGMLFSTTSEFLKYFFVLNFKSHSLFKKTHTIQCLILLDMLRLVCGILYNPFETVLLCALGGRIV